MRRRRRKELAEPDLWAGLQEQALKMRAGQTRAEQRLWQELRGGRINGLRFRRQHPVGRFIADFYCVQAALVIEVDGPVHERQVDSDAERDAYLQAMGLRVLRFTNLEVLSETGAVVERIKEFVTDMAAC